MTVADKITLRHAARARRKDLRQAVPGFAQALAHHADAIGVRSGMVVGGYHAMIDEADPALLLERLVELGAHIAFPRVAAKAQPLDYHRVPDGEVLAPGAFGIHEPLAAWPGVVPHLLLVPLLAFDARGHRLGYGGGFYDRSLACLPDALRIGCAYAAQEVSLVPTGPFDQKLHAIATETGVRRFAAPDQ